MGTGDREMSGSETSSGRKVNVRPEVEVSRHVTTVGVAQYSLTCLNRRRCVVNDTDSRRRAADIFISRPETAKKPAKARNTARLAPGGIQGDLQSRNYRLRTALRTSARPDHCVVDYIHALIRGHKELLRTIQY
ncbi:hypothetical protein J6590_034916 [Homalodisca vitripennis]|nr:hypothetical protein J6590_034916 [Homalodisca vitripennis]